MIELREQRIVREFSIAVDFRELYCRLRDHVRYPKFKRNIAHRLPLRDADVNMYERRKRISIVARTEEQLQKTESLLRAKRIELRPPTGPSPYEVYFGNLAAERDWPPNNKKVYAVDKAKYEQARKDRAAIVDELEATLGLLKFCIFKKWNKKQIAESFKVSPEVIQGKVVMAMRILERYWKAEIHTWERTSPEQNLYEFGSNRAERFGAKSMAELAGAFLVAAGNPPGAVDLSEFLA